MRENKSAKFGGVGLTVRPAALAMLLAGQVAYAEVITLTFDDLTGYSGGTSTLPTTYTESGFTFSANGAGNHLDPFTGTGCDTAGILCWHDGPSNAVEDNLLTLSFGGAPFDLLSLDFGNVRSPTGLNVSSSNGDAASISAATDIPFDWQGVTSVTFDIPGTTDAATLPFLDNVVVDDGSVSPPGPPSPATFDSDTAFLAAAPPTTLESFEGLANTPRDTEPIVTDAFTMNIVAVGPGSINWRVTDEERRDAAGTYPTHGSKFVEAGAGIASGGAPFAITFAFTDPIDAFGLNIADFGDLDGPGSLSLGDGLGNEFVIASIPPNLPNGNLLFFGLVNPGVPFSTLTLTKTTGTDGIVVDEVYFSRAQGTAPAPSTFMLMALGIVGMAVSRRRRGVR